MEELLKRREELFENIRRIDESAFKSSDGLDRILNAIKNQRWFFFANSKYITMDRDTAIIWANLDCFNWRNGYSNENSYQEVRNFIDKTNSERFGGFEDWQIPTPFELYKIYKETVPFKDFKDSNYYWISYNWCVNYNGELAGKSLSANGGATAGILNGNGVYVIPCNHSCVPDNYEHNISPSNNFYTEKEKLQLTLNVFVQNELIPIFKDAEITQLYRKIYVNKTALMKELAEIDAQIAESEKSQVKLTANFNYRPLLAKYDVATVNNSAIKYFDAVFSVTDELLGILQEYETAQAETIAEFLKIALKLNVKYTDNPNLTPEENLLLAERQKFLAQRLELGTDAPKQKILSVKAQAKEFFNRLDEINSGDNAIRELAALQAEPRADFELLVENLARIILDTQKRIDFFAEHKDLVSGVVEAQSAWSDNYKSFKTSLREELTAACRNDSIDEEIFAAWYEDWQKKRFAVEQRFLPLVEFALKGNLSDVLKRILAILLEYRDAVDKFYLHERKNIYQKFAFQAGGDLQEKFETESELYKLAEKLQRDLQEIIFSRDKTEDRIFLLRWSEPLLNLSIDEISNFIRDKELDAISEEVLTQFAALKRQNFATYLADAKSYGEAIQRREKEYNALIFRMRKDLYKS